MVRRHPEIAYDLLSHIQFPWGDVAEIIRHHHERLDGRGYPDGLAEDRISLEAKILMLAEAFDSMTSDQPWRMRLSFDRVIEEITKNLGIQFEPDVVAGLCRAVDAALEGKSRYDDFVPSLAAIGQPEIIQKMMRVLREELEARPPRESAEIIEIVPEG